MYTYIFIPFGKERLHFLLWVLSFEKRRCLLFFVVATKKGLIGIAADVIWLVSGEPMSADVIWFEPMSDTHED